MKPIYAIFAILMLAVLMTSAVPVFAWNYPDLEIEDYGVPEDGVYLPGPIPPPQPPPYGPYEDVKFEQFGPRVDKLLIKLYSAAEPEWDALERGEIDITDWPLTKPYYERFNQAPQNISIEKKYYGAEFGIRLIDVNNNNDPKMMNGDPNPVYPNPLGDTNDPKAIAFRRAMWHLVDRETWLPIIIGAGFYSPLYSTHGPSYGEFALPPINPYPYDPMTAAQLLENNGFPWHDDDNDGQMDPGERFWDKNGNGVRDAGEDLLLKYAIRSDDVHRLSVGRKHVEEMKKIGIAVEAREGPIASCIMWWFYNKEVHFYTAGWGLGVEPDHTYLWETDYHWHPGFCYNTGKVSNATYDAASKKVVAPNTEEEAKTNCLLCQTILQDLAACIPLYAYAGTMAVRRQYTGGTNGVPVSPDDGENAYRGKYWTGFVNVPGYGVDSFFSLLNLHPFGYAYGQGPDATGKPGNMTIRYGFKTAELKSFNPVYAEWTWEWIVMGLMYDSLIVRNPYNLAQWLPWIAKNYSVGLYNHPTLGPCTKVRISLRPDVTWSDGKALTVADIYFTWVELDDILKKRGLPPSWHKPAFSHILSFSILDPYNFECLLDMKSIYGLGYIASIILPKHIWKPLAESGDVTSMTADPDMICNGPYRFVEYVANSHVLMAANKPGVTIQTSHAGSKPVTSPYGYFRYYPLYVDVHLATATGEDWWTSKVLIDGAPSFQIKVTLHNLVQEQYLIAIEGPPPTNPVSTDWIEIRPNCNPPNVWHITSWEDNGDSILSACDQIDMVHAAYPTDTEWFHVEWVYNNGTHTIMELIPEIVVNKYVYLDGNPLVEGEEVTLRSCVPYVEYFAGDSTKGMHTVEVKVHIKSLNWDSWKLKCKWINYTFRYWCTIKEDIAGGILTYYDTAPIDPNSAKQIPTPDCKVDMINDIRRAARAFGSYPGHERWDTAADINGDYKVDMVNDIRLIAKKFGWS